MKPLFWLGVLLTAVQSFAKNPELDMICVTEIPSTSFVIKQTGEKISVRVFHHSGSQYAPFWNSLITPSDLEILSEQARVVEKLGNLIEITWNAVGCEVKDPQFFGCIGDAEKLVANGLEVQPWALSVTQVEEKTMWGDFKKKNLSLRVSVDEKSYQITSDYYDKDCVKSSDPAAASKLALIPLK